LYHIREMKEVIIMTNKAIGKAQADRIKLAKEYNVSTSDIVWIGDNHYIVIKNGKEIRI